MHSQPVSSFCPLFYTQTLHQPSQPLQSFLVVWSNIFAGQVLLVALALELVEQLPHQLLTQRQRPQPVETAVSQDLTVGQRVNSTSLAVIARTRSSRSETLPLNPSLLAASNVVLHLSSTSLAAIVRILFSSTRKSAKPSLPPLDASNAALLLNSISLVAIARTRYS